MKTVITKNIDGIDIIINTGDAGGLIDPLETKKIVDVEIQKSEHYKTIQQINTQIKVYRNQAQQAKKNSIGAVIPTEKKKFWDEHIFRSKQADELMPDLKEPTAEMGKEYKLLMVKHAIYFNSIPAEGVSEKIIPDEECKNIREKLNEATQKNMLLSRDLKLIKDVRGKVFFKKESDGWKAWQASKIIDNPPSGYVQELTDDEIKEVSEQRENERIAGLNSQAKTAEKENIISGIVARAGIMKNELEVSGDSGALKKAQGWLEKEKKVIENMYK